MTEVNTVISLVNGLNIGMNKFGWDYFVKRAEIIEEAGRPVKHPWVNSFINGENATIYKKLASDVLDMFRKGATRDGTPLVDSQGNRAAGLTTSSDDRYNKWILENLIEGTQTDDIRKIELDEDVINKIANGPIGEYFLKTFGDAAENKLKKYLFRVYQGEDSSSIIAQAARIAINNSIEDNTDYLTHAMKGAPLMKTAIALIVKKNPDILTSEKFKSIVFDPTNVADNMNHLEKGRVNIHNLWSTSSAERKLQAHGQEVEKDFDHEGKVSINPDDLISKIHKIDTETSNIIPLLTIINRKHGYKYGREIDYKRRKDAKFKAATQKADNSAMADNMVSIDTDIPIGLSAILKIIKRQSEEVKNAVNSYEGSLRERMQEASDTLGFSKNAIDILYFMEDDIIDRLLQFLQLRINDGKGLHIDEFYDVMDDIQSQFSGADAEDAADVMSYIEFAIDSSMKMKTMIDKQKSVGEYHGFDINILNEILNTPEKKSLFETWYKTIYLPRRLYSIKADLAKINANKAEDPSISSTDLNRGIQNFQQSRTVEPDPASQSAYIDDDDFDAKLGLSTKKPKDEWDDEEDDDYEEDEESYVMGYMTEQVSKDRFKPKGEFKERGFKKPINYAHWLDINK